MPKKYQDNIYKIYLFDLEKSLKIRIFVSTRSALFAGLVGYLLVKDVYGRYLRCLKSRKFDKPHRDTATEASMSGVLYPAV